MKIIILSDTHIKPGRSLLALLPKDLIHILKSSDIIIHAGDFETLECYNELKGLGKLIAQTVFATLLRRWKQIS